MECDAICKYLKTNHNSRGKAALSKQLEAAFSCKGTEIRKCINTLRSKGVPICSCANGYFYSGEADDISKTLNQLHSRISKIEQAKDGLEQFILAERRTKDAEKN